MTLDPNTIKSMNFDEPFFLFLLCAKRTLSIRQLQEDAHAQFEGAAGGHHANGANNLSSVENADQKQVHDENTAFLAARMMPQNPQQTYFGVLRGSSIQSTWENCKRRL